ncbi:MAG: cell division protein ZapE [Rickettsiales bacterium]
MRIEETYLARTNSGELRFDERQRRIAQALDEILDMLKDATSIRRSAWTRILSRKKRAAPKGLYVHGAVGRGKTLLMDVFVECARNLPVRRAHFHDFMKDVHRRLRRARASSGVVDPIDSVASDMAKEATILCFDEMEVHDVADATLLERLFSRLFAEGTTLICTSNVPPEELYKEGLQREHILPFIALLRDRCRVERLDAEGDYRLRGKEAKREEKRWFRADTEGTEALRLAVLRYAPPGGFAPESVRVVGRETTFRRVANGALWTDFDELCRRPLGAGDYADLCSAFSVIAVENVPTLHAGETHPLLRFIHFIDVAYEKRVALLWSGADEPEAIYPHEPKPYGFARMVSRLREMRSDAYCDANTA